MESKYLQIVLLSLILTFTSCSENKEFTPISADTNLFENGDIICRLGNGFFSNRFRDYADSEKTYSHVGIIEKANDSLFVIHAEANEFTGVGFVKREEIHSFLKEVKSWGLFRIDADFADIESFIFNAKDYYVKKTPFDMDFDLNKDDKVYCTELIALCFNKSFKDIDIQPNLFLKNKIYYSVSDIYKHPKVKPIFKSE